MAARSEFTAAERDYFTRQRPLARLGTLGPDGAPQVRPVGFFPNPDGTVDIGGYDLGRTQKFRNVQADGRVSLVIDDIASRDPWRVRGVEIRGRAQALEDVDPPMRMMSREVIRIHPERIASWGLPEDAD